MQRPRVPIEWGRMGVNTGTAVLILGVGFAFLALLFATFRSPDAPHVDRLVFFVLLMAATGALGFLTLVHVFGYDPNPRYVSIARRLTKDKVIYLGDIVPGLYHLNYIHRVDTDGEEEALDQEWLAFYQYDVDTSEDQQRREGPFGAAIYDPDDCRPPAILSFELVPVNYQYLGEDGADVQVANIIAYQEPQPDSGGLTLDRPEVIIKGFTRGAVTDLNIFRKLGVPKACAEREQWQKLLSYENIGSFRASYVIERSGSTITVVDRDVRERSQFVVRKTYVPVAGTYFQPGTKILREPVEYSLAFGPGEPDEVTQVYYPEKALLAFYLALGKGRNQNKAEGYLSESARATYDIKRDLFGLSSAPGAVGRDDLGRVLVWEIRYTPDVEAEQLHTPRVVSALVVGVDQDGTIDREHACEVTWTVVGVPNRNALPYGCEWRLDHYDPPSCP